jgi:hypothetical protein
MANTTYFGWETPDDTDLVKDGAAAIRTLGQAIDTSMQDLEGGTTGQILAKNSNADMDFVWVTNDVGDITEIVASTPLTGGGSSGSVTVGIQDGTTAQKGAIQLEDSTSSTSTTKASTPNSVKSAYDLANAAIPKSLVDAAGDLIYATADNTPARLALGTAGQVLKVNSGATAPEWGTASAGALTLISSTTFTSSSSHSVNDVFSSTYDNYLVAISVDNGAVDFCNLRFRVSGSDNTSSNYYWSDFYNQSNTQNPAGNYSNGLTTSWRLGYFEANSYGYSLVNIFNPNRTANTSANWEHNRFASNSTNQRGSGTLSVTTAYTGFTIFPPTGNMTGKVRVYGYQNS